MLVKGLFVRLVFQVVVSAIDCNKKSGSDLFPLFSILQVERLAINYVHLRTKECGQTARWPRKDIA